LEQQMGSPALVHQSYLQSGRCALETATSAYLHGGVRPHGKDYKSLKWTWHRHHQRETREWRRCSHGKERAPYAGEILGGKTRENKLRHGVRWLSICLGTLVGGVVFYPKLNKSVAKINYKTQKYDSLLEMV
jgi:hypothetical protein